MSFFPAKLEHRIKKLPMRGRKKLPLRAARGRRLSCLKQFEVGHLYTFTQYFATDLPDDLPEDLLLEDHKDEHYRNC